MNPSEFFTIVTDTVVEDRESESLHPSGLRSCDRKMMLGLSGAKKSHPMSQETRWKLARYGTYEALFDKGFEKAASTIGYQMAKQVELRWMDFHGYVDFAVIGDESIYVEIKSTSPSAFNRGSMPYETHKAQAQAYYVMAYESELDNPPSKVFLLYVGRWYEGKLPEIRFYDVTPTQEEYNELKAYMETLQSMKDGGYIPEVPFSHSGEHPWLCTRKNWRKKVNGEPTIEISCEYYDHCWKNELPL